MIFQLPAATSNQLVYRAHLFHHRYKVLCKYAHGLLLLAGLASAVLPMSHAIAQQLNPNPDPNPDIAREISIQRVSHGEFTTVPLGELVSGIAVERTVGDDYSTSYAVWTLEPAGLAQIITPMPVRPLNQPIEVEFLEPGIVTLTAYGYDEQGETNETGEPGFNTAVFTFNIEAPGTNIQVPGTSGESVSETLPLSANARTVLSTCTSINNSSNGGTAGQGALRTTCELIALQDNPGANLDRLIPEEFFSISDALTTTADSQLSNVQARIQAVKSGNRTGLDMDSLTVRIGDQTISSSVLTASKDALWRLGDGDTSQTIISDSALGLFANGNISIGDINGDGTQSDASVSTNTLTIGADYRIDKNIVLGAAAGMVNNSTEFKGDNGDMDMRGINISAFGTWYEQDKGYADMIVDVGQNSFDLSRRINIIGAANEFAESSADTTRLSLSINVGRTFHRGAIEFGPLARITITRAAIDGFSETSTISSTGTGTTFDVQRHTMTSSRFAIGGEIKRVFNTSRAVFVPSARIELENESETDKGPITASFRNDPEKNQMQITGTERDSSALLTSIGASAVFAHGQSAFVFFETRALDDFVQQNRIRIGYRMHF